MRYLFLMYGAEDCWSEAERLECVAKSMRICDDLSARGKFIATAPLQSVATAATVRMREGRTFITEGPYAETTEQLGGYFLVDLADLDEAIAVVSQLPSVTKGAAEIRPVLPLQGLPPSRPFPVGTKDEAGEPYLLLCYDDEAAWKAAGPNAQTDAMAEAAALCHQLRATGNFLTASPLHAAATATCVRVRQGKREITDGPFAETHEMLGGFYVILAKSRAQALEIAARHPGLRHGCVEVRPLIDFSGLHSSLSVS